ncbi:uncharacterized protein LOC9650580 [Selaginella moellendorffii]|nr:uncharacterized protein LOC9650580 [Selaginella moellendorffii]XP_024533056.1 uncharacterized protein LOC9650580 [Selaginella moellendorffii]|eukprot:XP_002972243.2 uncharacterized protein LOC9650580 [Selaginella moellendorffii]
MKGSNYTAATSGSSSSSSGRSSFCSGLGIIKDFLSSAGILFSSLARGSTRLLPGARHEPTSNRTSSRRRRRSISPDDREMHELDSHLSRPFASFGSYRQRHGDELTIHSEHKTGMSVKAPAKLAPTTATEQAAATTTPPRRYHRQTSAKMSTWSTEIDHDREWERRKGLINSSSTKKKVVERCVSDCTGMRSSNSVEHVRTRSLTDADLDELRGCIDLGFGFKNEADPELWKTLPALELCYAITQQLKEVQRPSPVSPLADAGDFSSESGGDDSLESSPTFSSWQIASPGDRPQEVKTRLRHWARAVACTVRQSL